MNTRVIILAAGMGTRMGADVPKPLVEVSGRSMIMHLLDAVHESKVDERPILVVAPDSVETFNDLCENHGCEYAVQEKQLGTGHAVGAARERANTSESVIVLYGDHPFITAEVLEQLQELHAEGNSVVSMLTAKVKNFKKDNEGFLHWGRIIRDEVGVLVATREYKDATEEEREIKEINPGIYMFDSEWLWDHLSELKNENASEEYYITDLVEMAIEEGEHVATAVVDNPFIVMGINTPEELERAERLMG